MVTKRLLINKDFPEKDKIEAAAEYLKQGEVVAFPTETVYGLGAVALNAPAVERIFAAKNRPAANPLIIHIGKLEQAFPLVKVWPENADRLARTFWPGPLTLILPAADNVPSVVRGGGSGVGIRMPAHPVALALINASAPLAAPSANRSGRPSPRTADEVWEDLNGRIPLLLDAGATPGGIESTVLNLTVNPPVVVRPGGITREQIEQCLGIEVIRDEGTGPGATLPHYQSSAQVLAVTAAELNELLGHFTGKKVAIIANNKLNINNDISPSIIYPLTAAGEFFTLLRQAEKDRVEVLIVVKDSGLNWDEALQHRVQAAVHSSPAPLGKNNKER